MKVNLRTIGVAVFLIFMAVSGYLRSSNRQSTQELDRIATELKGKAQALMQRQLAGEDVGAEQEKLFDDFIIKAEKAGQGAKGEFARAMRAMVLTLRDIQAPLRAYNAASAQVSAILEGGPYAVKSIAEIETRIATIENFRRMNDGLDSVYKALPDRMRRNLLAEGLTGTEVDSAVAGFNSNPRFRTTADIRQCDREMANALLGQFELLKTEFGKWELVEGSDGPLVEFQNDAAATAFDKFHDDIQTAGERQENLQRQMMAQ